MDRIPVSSSNIRSIGYDPELAILEVEFTSNAIYRYLNVPENLYQRLMSTGSKGQFLNDYIKYGYRYQRIR